MTYRNRETGATVDVVSELSGVWEPVKAPTAKKPTKAGKPEKEASGKKDDEK